MTAAATRHYHHGRLRDAVIEAAIDQVASSGVVRVSMREIARRAGVSHAAPAHHFGDKAGIFTAIAEQGFRLISETIAPLVGGPDAFIAGGIAYIQFALTHPAHFEVMFRPDLYRTDDPDLVGARDAAFAIMHECARAAVGEAASEEDVAGLAVAGWSASHGFATLWLHANLQDRLGDDPLASAGTVLRGVVGLGTVTRHYLERNDDVIVSGDVQAPR